MRWRLLRRRLTVSASRMTVRSHLPWPLRWAVAALMLGFCGALGLWAFEFGRDIAGLRPGHPHDAQHLSQLQQQIETLRQERDRAQSLANTADTLITAERVTQARLGEQVKALEAENLSLRDDLGFFERLLPASNQGEVSVRGLQADIPAPGQLRFQVLVMQRGGRIQPPFRGQYELLLSGTQEGRPWSHSGPVIKRTLQFKQYHRIDGAAQYPADAVIKKVVIRVLNTGDKEVATQSLRL